MKFPHPYYLKHDIKPLSKLPLFRAEERLGLWFAVLHRRALLQSVLLQGLQGNPCSCTWITSSHCFGLLLLRSIGLVTFKMKLWRFTTGEEALVGWTVLSLQQEGAWVSLWDGGREVSGRQIRVSTYYHFLVMIVCWFCMFVGLLIGFFGVFLTFYCSQISPAYLSTSYAQFSRMLQRESQTEGALSTIFIQLIL